MIKVSKLHEEEWFNPVRRIVGRGRWETINKNRRMAVLGGYIYDGKVFVPGPHLNITWELPNIKDEVKQSLLEQEQERLESAKRLVALQESIMQDLEAKKTELRAEIIALEQQRDALKKKPLWDVLLGRR